MAALIALSLPACGREDPGKNLLTTKAKDKKTVRLYSPMEKTMAGGENVARTAFDKTVAMAEEKLGIAIPLEDAAELTGMPELLEVCEALLSGRAGE